MTGKEWDEEVAKMTSAQRIDMINAIEALHKWEAFKWEYGWTSYHVLAAILETAEMKANQ